MVKIPGRYKKSLQSNRASFFAYMSYIIIIVAIIIFSHLVKKNTLPENQVASYFSSVSPFSFLFIRINIYTTHKYRSVQILAGLAVECGRRVQEYAFEWECITQYHSSDAITRRDDDNNVCDLKCTNVIIHAVFMSAFSINLFVHS